jgi:hypothetical protein
MTLAHSALGAYFLLLYLMIMVPVVFLGSVLVSCLAVLSSRHHQQARGMTPFVFVVAIMQFGGVVWFLSMRSAETSLEKTEVLYLVLAMIAPLLLSLALVLSPKKQRSRHIER